jgi:hypothetical protein
MEEAQVQTEHWQLITEMRVNKSLMPQRLAVQKVPAVKILVVSLFHVPVVQQLTST